MKKIFNKGYVLYSNGTLFHNDYEMKQTINYKGYCTNVILADLVGTTMVHRAIALTFIPIPEKYKDIPIEQLQVNHIDGNKTNNDISNLEWCTCKENVHHAIITGLDYRQNIRDERIYGIIQDRNNYMPMDKLVEKYGISATSIYRLLKENNCYEPRRISNNPLVNECIALRNDENLSITTISEILGIGETTVYVYLKENPNYKPKHKKLTEEEKQEVLRRYKELKQSASKIARELKVSKPNVLRYLRTFDWYNGNDRKPNTDNKYDFEQITQWRNEGKSWKDICKLINEVSKEKYISNWYNTRKRKNLT